MSSLHIPVTNFDLRHSLESGQCFEWEPYDQGYAAVLGTTFCSISQQGSTLLITAKQKIAGRLVPLSYEQYPKQTEIFLRQLRHYFSLDVPYSDIVERIAVDPIMERAIAKYHGLRVLKQPHFSCIIGFLLSGNNNLKKIQLSRKMLCTSFGEHIYTDLDGRSFYALPTLEQFRNISEEDLRSCKTGYRATFLHRLVHMIDPGRITALDRMPYSEAKTFLMQYHGIGEKIADCILLYSYHFQNIYPTDVWVKRFTRQLYLPHANEREIREFGMQHFNGYGGWAQLFLYIAFREGYLR